MSLFPSTPKLKFSGSRFILFLNRHWMLVFSLAFGLLVLAPFLAPVFMQLGWEKPARFIYLFYSLLCHQLPQRSFFLFGEKSMYSLAEVETVWQNTIDPHILRQYIGDAQFGWKVAWSDRMVSMYTSVLLFAWFWYLFLRRRKPLPPWGLALMLLPMALDGGTHLVSDLSGLGQGFRDSNHWLAEITNHTFSPEFYAGDAFGSFNSWMRLLSGIPFGLGLTWFALPLFDQSFREMEVALQSRFDQLEQLKSVSLEELFK